MKINRTMLFKLKKALLKLSEIQTEEGVTLITDGDNELGVGVEVFVNSDEGLIPATDGQYSYNGQIITVEGGVISNIAEKPTEENTPAEETPVEENAEEETPANEEEKPATEEEDVITEEVVEVAEEINEEVKNEDEVDVEALKSRIAELEALVEELKAKLEEPVADSVETEMKKQEKFSNENKINYSRFREAVENVKRR